MKDFRIGRKINLLRLRFKKILALAINYFRLADYFLEIESIIRSKGPRYTYSENWKQSKGTIDGRSITALTCCVDCQASFSFQRIQMDDGRKSFTYKVQDPLMEYDIRPRLIKSGHFHFDDNLGFLIRSFYRVEREYYEIC